MERYNELLSPVISSTPFWRHNDLNRLQMVGKHHMQAQIPLQPEMPLVYTEHYNLFKETSFKITCPFDAKVLDVFGLHVLLENKETKERTEIPIPYYLDIVVSPGDEIQRGEIIAVHKALRNLNLPLEVLPQGRNADVAFGFEDGYVYEDAIVADELVKDEFTTFMPDTIELELNYIIELLQTPVVNWPLKPGIFARIYEGPAYAPRLKEVVELRYPFLVKTIFVPPEGVLKQYLKRQPSSTARFLLKQRKETEKGQTNWRQSVLWRLFEFAEEDSPALIKILGLQIQKVRLGDKFTNRHGNKGVISTFKDLPAIKWQGGGFEGEIKPRFVLSPYGIGRMNMGQLVEFHYAFLLKHVVPQVVKAERRLKSPVSIIEKLIKTFVYPVEPVAALDVIGLARQMGASSFLDFVEKYGLPVKISNTMRADYYRRVLKLYKGLGIPYERKLGGKVYSFGVMYMHKLELVAAEKIKAVSIPGGDEKGQRIGEQEHWALLAQGNIPFLEEVALRGDKFGQIELARHTLTTKPASPQEVLQNVDLEVMHEANALLTALGVPTELKWDKSSLESYRRWRERLEGEEKES